MKVKPRDGDTEDVFILDSHPPYTLREWRKADGGILKLKHSLKIDYWNYNKLGDLERLLAPAEPRAPAPEAPKEEVLTDEDN